jgi:hypothetical protein
MGPDDFDLSTAALRLAVLVRVRRTLADASGLECTIEHDGPRLRIRLTGPPVDHGTERAMAVRALDAVRSMDRTFGEVDVEYGPHPTPTALPR